MRFYTFFLGRSYTEIDILSERLPHCQESRTELNREQAWCGSSTLARVGRYEAINGTFEAHNHIEPSRQMDLGSRFYKSGFRFRAPSLTMSICQSHGYVCGKYEHTQSLHLSPQGIINKRGSHHCMFISSKTLYVCTRLKKCFSDTIHKFFGIYMQRSSLFGNDPVQPYPQFALPHCCPLMRPPILLLRK